MNGLLAFLLRNWLRDGGLRCSRRGLSYGRRFRWNVHWWTSRHRGRRFCLHIGQVVSSRHREWVHW